MEENQNIVVPLRGGYGGVNYLENNFFPFDPYLLRRSEKYIVPIYQKWEHPTINPTTGYDSGDFGANSQFSNNSQRNDFYCGSAGNSGMMDEWDRLRNLSKSNNHRNSEANNFLFESLHSPQSKSPLLNLMKKRPESYEDDMMDDDGIFDLSEDEQDEYNDDSSLDSGDEEQFDLDDDEYYEASHPGMLIGQRGRSPPRAISIKQRRESGSSCGRNNSSLLAMSIGSGSLEDSPVKSPYGWNAISLSPHV